MKPGKLALLRFPQVNLEEGKLRLDWESALRRACTTWETGKGGST